MSKRGLLSSFILSNSFFGKEMKIDYAGLHMSVALLSIALVAMVSGLPLDYAEISFTLPVELIKALSSLEVYIDTRSGELHPRPSLIVNLPVEPMANIGIWYWVRRLPLFSGTQVGSWALMN